MSDQYLSWDQLQAMHPTITAGIEDKKKRDQWLKERSGNITASAISKLLTSKYAVSDGDTAKMYLLDKVAEIITDAPLPEFGNAATRHGNDTEPEALEAYQVRTKSKLTFPGFIKKDGYGATPDGIVPKKGKTAKGCVQIKCPYEPRNHAKHLMLKTAADLKTASVEYYSQIQMEMYVSGSEWCDWVSYDNRYPEPLNLHIVRVERDAEVIEAIKTAINKGREFIQTSINKIKS